MPKINHPTKLRCRRASSMSASAALPRSFTPLLPNSEPERIIPPPALSNRVNTLVIRKLGMQAANPILGSWNGNCYGAPPYESISAQDILPALQECIDAAIAEIDDICSNSEEQPTFANTVIPFETGISLEKLRQVRSLFTSAVNTVEALVSEKAPGHLLLEKFDHHVCQSKFFGRLCKVPTDDLPAEDARLVRVLIEGFIAKGTTLKDDSEPAINSLKTDLSQYRSVYVQAIKDQMSVPTELELSHPSTSDAQLLSAYSAKAPESLGETCSNGEERKTVSSCRYVIPNHPDVVERLLSQCSDRSVRERVWTNFRDRGKPTNYKTARDILIVRSKISNIMGFQNHAKYKMRNSMVPDPAEVIRLYTTLLQPAKQAFQSELDQLLELSKCDGISDSRDFKQWDYKFYLEKLRSGDTSLVSVDELPTFKLSGVINGLVWLVQELYGVAMSPAFDAPKYHADALAYSLKRAPDSLLGLMYVDVWSRPGKAPGNWTHQIVRPSSFSGSRPVVSLNCNFKRLFTDPETLNFDHVKLLLHEFGHCLHCLHSDVKYASLSGMCTPDDHVELPSSLHEKFLQDPRFLSQVTSSPLPVGICNRLIANDCKSIGFTLLRNISSSILDLRLHTLPLDALETLDVEAFEKVLYAELGMPPQVSYLYESSAFDHIFRFDYRYYMYLWSSVLVSSALSVFLRGGIHEFDAGVFVEGRRQLLGAKSDEEDTCSADVTPHVITPSAHDPKPSALSSTLKATDSHQEASSVLTSEALASRLSGIDVASASSGPAATDGFSLVHRAAGCAFVDHVLSKGNSIDVWQGFLSFVGGRFDPTDYLRQRGLDSNLPGFTMQTK